MSTLSQELGTRWCEGHQAHLPLDEFIAKPRKHVNLCRKCILCRKEKRRRDRDPERTKALKKAERERHHETYLERDRAYYAAHREEIIARAAQWRKDNRERANAGARARRDRNIVEAREKERDKRARNAEGQRAIAMRYREAHREECNERIRSWRMTHPEQRRLYVVNRRARLRDAPGVLRPADWEAIKAAQDYRCLDCGLREPDIKLTVDHIMPLIRGGTNEPTSNIAALCGPCNSRKGARVAV